VQTLEDHGTPGNLTAEQSQQAIDANRQTFVSFATALRGVGSELLKAVEAKDTDAMMEAGATMDQVCEGCHLKFWYPGQKIPRFPDEAPEEDLPQPARK
jgi:cytochrome c556